MSIRTISPGISSRAKRALLLAPALLLLLVFYAVPVLSILSLSVFDKQAGTLTLGNFVAIFSQPLYLNVFITTVTMSLIIVVTSLVLSYPLAYFIARAPSRSAKVVMLCVMFPFWVSALVRTFSWTVLLQSDGTIGKIMSALHLVPSDTVLVQSKYSLLAGMVQILMPFMVFPIYNAIREIDWRIIRAAESLGAGRFTIATRILLPLSAPGIAAGSVLVFILSMGAYIQPVLLGSRRDVFVAQLIELQASQLLNWNMASALCVVLLVVTFGLVYLMNKIFNINAVMGR